MRRLAWRRTVESTFELTVAVAWGIVGLAYLSSPGTTALRSPVGRDLGTFAAVWSVFEVLGAVLAVWGLLRARLSLRVAGLVLIGTGLLMQGFAAATFRFDLRVLVYFIYCVACGARALALVVAERRERA